MRPGTKSNGDSLNFCGKNHRREVNFRRNENGLISDLASSFHRWFRDRRRYIYRVFLSRASYPTVVGWCFCKSRKTWATAFPTCGVRLRSLQLFDGVTRFEESVTYDGARSVGKCPVVVLYICQRKGWSIEFIEHSLAILVEIFRRRLVTASRNSRVIFWP